MLKTWLLLSAIFGIIYGLEHDFKGFDDSIIFGIKWPGNSEDTIENFYYDGEVNSFQKKEILKVTTSNKEKYECRIPELRTKESNDIGNYDGPSPLNLLKPLFTQKICSYRLEGYWSYEVCHGRYIRQYHEERDGKQPKVQEYYLGHWSLEKQLKLESEVQSEVESKALPRTTKVDGQTVPFVEMVMGEGTICDLNGKPRMTRILYVCYIHGKHEVYSFKETSTCEYEVIILSPLLCEHPLFKPKEVSENIITCLPVDGAPKQPRKMLQSEVEAVKFNQQTIQLNNDELKDLLAVVKVEKVDKDGETHLRFELHPLNEEENVPEKTTKFPELVDKAYSASNDNSPVAAFLNGETCLNGGSGWWKYEFCYGKHVTQYHVDRGGEKQTVLLGKFDKQAHLDWIKENKGKAPKPVEERTSISHFYSNGDICDKTGKPRQTEVKLKCSQNAKSAQVSLYLLEPKTCHYIVGVESPLICHILPFADETGLIKFALDPEKEKSSLKKEESEKIEND